MDPQQYFSLECVRLLFSRILEIKTLLREESLDFNIKMVENAIQISLL